MRAFHRALLRSTIALVLAGCQTAPVVRGGFDPADPTWSLTGKLGVIADKQRGSFTIDWRQDAGTFEIQLLGPLGINVARIEGAGASVTLLRPGEDPVAAASADLLLRRALGLAIPVTPMRYWVRGKPAPGAFRKTATGFIQGGWTVEYLSFEQQLPVRMKASRPEVRLTIVVRQWNS